MLTGRSLAPIAQALTGCPPGGGADAGNIVISNLYNLIAVPVAVAGLATPLAAAIAMSTSSISVTLNALRIRRA